MANERVFENKASTYRTGRPSYAPEILDKLLHEILPANGVVADIGSGTGILTKEFVQNGYETYAVEPNRNMRMQAENILSEYPCFHSIDASAEYTGLGDSSVSLITAASAFHWFDTIPFKRECARILRHGGLVCIISNVRVHDVFSQKQYMLCKKFCDTFESFTHGYDKTVRLLDSFFDKGYATSEYDFPLEYTKKKFISRCLSSSYAPLPGSTNYASYIAELKALLDETFAEETFRIANKTVMFVGEIV